MPGSAIFGILGGTEDLPMRYRFAQKVVGNWHYSDDNRYGFQQRRAV